MSPVQSYEIVMTVLESKVILCKKFSVDIDMAVFKMEVTDDWFSLKINIFISFSAVNSNSIEKIY